MTFTELPEKIQLLVNNYYLQNESEDPYFLAKIVKIKLNAAGYDCDYDLSGVLFDFREF